MNVMNSPTRVLILSFVAMARAARSATTFGHGQGAIDEGAAGFQSRARRDSDAARAVVALAVSGMNDVLHSPAIHAGGMVESLPHCGTRALMAAIAICCNLLIGWGAHRSDRRLFLILPITVSISFFLISDIDSPRGGAIQVVGQNLLSPQSLRGQ